MQQSKHISAHIFRQPR